MSCQPSGIIVLIFATPCATVAAVSSSMFCRGPSRITDRFKCPASVRRYAAAKHARFVSEQLVSIEVPSLPGNFVDGGNKERERWPSGQQIRISSRCCFRRTITFETFPNPRTWKRQEPKPKVDSFNGLYGGRYRIRTYDFHRVICLHFYFQRLTTPPGCHTTRKSCNLAVVVDWASG